ncbi:hypothetical protein [Acinetobacter baumannii]|uniref:hypothetical protein n=1 Tax=Acinetobacter baumannii TaxID=470 RepID=UPI0037C06569
MHEKFEDWIKAQPFYIKLIYIHGERLFIRDNGEYQIFAMEVPFKLGWFKEVIHAIGQTKSIY